MAYLLGKLDAEINMVQPEGFMGTGTKESRLSAPTALNKQHESATRRLTPFSLKSGLVRLTAGSYIRIAGN